MVYVFKLVDSWENDALLNPGWYDSSITSLHSSGREMGLKKCLFTHPRSSA